MSEDELFRLAFICAERDQEAFVEAHRHMPSDPAAIVARELLAALRAYRLKRWGKTAHESLQERCTTVTVDELMQKKGT